MAKSEEWKDFDYEDLVRVCGYRDIPVTDKDTVETLIKKLSPKPAKPEE